MSAYTVEYTMKGYRNKFGMTLRQEFVDTAPTNISKLNFKHLARP